MSIDGLVDVPDTGDAAEFGTPVPGTHPGGVSQPGRDVGGARRMLRCWRRRPMRLQGSGGSRWRGSCTRGWEDWLLIADRTSITGRLVHGRGHRGRAAVAGQADLTLQPLEFHRDGSYTSVLVNPRSGAVQGSSSSTRPAPARTWTQAKATASGGRIRGPRSRRRRERRSHRPDHHHHYMDGRARPGPGGRVPRTLEHEPETSRSRRFCAARERSCARSPRTW